MYCFSCHNWSQMVFLNSCMFESPHIVHTENTMNQIWKSRKQYLRSLYYSMSYFHDRKSCESAVALLIQIFKYTTRETLFFHVNKKKMFIFEGCLVLFKNHHYRHQNKNKSGQSNQHENKQYLQVCFPHMKWLIISARFFMMNQSQDIKKRREG